jgi:hypothetical protein
MSAETETFNELLDDDDIEGEEWSEEERRLVRALIGGHMSRLHRMRHLMLSHLLRDRMAGDEEDEEEAEESGDEDVQLFRLLVATGILRRRRLRRRLLAHLQRERTEEGGTDEREGEEGSDEERHAAESLAPRRKGAVQSERAEAAHAGGKPRREKRRRAIRR